MPESPRAAAEQEHVQVLAATQAASLADFAELMKPVAESIIAFPAPSPHRSEPVQVLVAEPAPAQAGDEQPSSDNDGEPNDNNDLGDIDNDSDSDDASPKGHAAANVTSKHVYTAVYSGIPVYEMMFRGVQIMRRIADGWLNATHILKAAAYSKPRRTKILEQEVLQGVHEKVQGGYGKYQGTWIPKEDGVKLARRHRVEALLRPIIDFEPENGDVALPKLNFNLKHSSGSTSAKLLRPPNNSDASERPRRGGLEPSTLPISGGLTNASRPTSPVPVPSPVSRHRVTQNSYSVNIPVAPQTPPAVPVKRPVGRPPRIPRQPGYLPPAKNNALKLPIQKSRRMSYDHIEVPSSPPGVQIRIGMELGNIVHLNNPFLPAAENDIELATLFRDPSSYESNRSFSMTPHELSSLSVFQDFSLSEMTRDQLQRRIISQIYLGAPIPEILSMLRDSNFVLGEDDSLENDGAGADNRSSTLPLVVTKSSRFVLPPINANMILDSRQQTALHWAAQQARTDLIAALLTHGANACAPSLGSLETPLMRASTTQAAYDADCFADVIALLGGPSARCTDAHGRNILHLIARITVERIGNTTFWREVQEEYMSCVFDWIDDGGFVSWVEHSVMLEYKTNIKVAVAAFVNAKDVDGNTPLYNAIQTGSHNVAEMLVKLGASMDIRNTAGKSPRDMFGDEGVPLAFGTGVSIPFKAHEVENTGNFDFGSFVLNMQKLIAQPEIDAMHGSQRRFEKLRQEAVDKNRLLKQSQNTAYFLTRSLPTADTAPTTSATTTSSNNSKSLSPAKVGVPKIEVFLASDSGTDVHSSRFPSSRASSTPSRQISDSLLPTPPTTVKLSNRIPDAHVTFSSTLITEKLRGKIEERENLRKRIFAEINSVWERREEKTRRYKKLLAEACNVELSKINDVLESN